MSSRQDGVAVYHSGAGIFHHRLDLLPHIRFIAMHRTFRASGLVFPKGASFKALRDIVKKPPAFRTAAFSPAMLSMAEDIDHQLSRFDFLLHS
jgi:hypothetical protein